MAEFSGTGEWTPAVAERGGRFKIAGFEILEELGRGGMGVVYRARHASSQRLVALKVVRDGALASPQELARFRIEAESAARMRHPNIIQIHEVGEHQGQPYFAMELVEGRSLDRCLAGQPQPAALAAELIRTLALAVQHAHAQQVVHRDLKPANVLIATDFAGQGTIASLKSANPKIADFGLAKRLDSQSTALTQAGAVVGTPSYMAPEQAAGRVAEIGPAADIYALGAILYELLTGRPPFVAETWSQTLQQLLHEEPTPPTLLHSGVPPDLETACLKCLEKEPGQHYPTALELADDLGRFLAGRAIVATPLNEKQRLLRRAARDGYQVLDEIGHGPGSTVYRALYGPLKQPVALKILSARSCTREVWEDRLKRGAELWAAIAHPQVVLVQRAGWWDGAPYVDAEYVPHGSLATRLAGGPWPWAMPCTCSSAVDVGAALAGFHHGPLDGLQRERAKSRTRVLPWRSRRNRKADATTERCALTGLPFLT